MKLYTYYRSQASFRLRIALNLKGIAREDSFLLGEGRSPASPSATREGRAPLHHTRQQQYQVAEQVLRSGSTRIRLSAVGAAPILPGE